MEWTLTTIDLGDIKERVRTQIIFKVRTTNNKEILGLDASCGCSVPRWDKESKRLTVDYTPGAVPKHLLMEGKKSYKSSKMIYVKYDDGTNDTLTFTANVTK